MLPRPNPWPLRPFQLGGWLIQRPLRKSPPTALKSNSASTGDANVATLLSWFVPGAGHFYLGKPKTALIAFLVVEGLFAIGLALSKGMTYEFLDPELQGRFAMLLTPEVGNLGGLLYQMRGYGFGQVTTVPHAWPAHIMLGSLLTALSGILNACVMMQANLDARISGEDRQRGRSPALLAGFAWLLPGLGHFLQGRRARAFLVFFLLVGLFALGTGLAAQSNLSRERHFYYWAGQFLIGLPAIATEFISGRPPVTGEITHVDAGLTIACIAGLLNVMAMLDVFRYGEDVLLGEAPEKRTSPGAEAAA